MNYHPLKEIAVYLRMTYIKHKDMARNLDRRILNSKFLTKKVGGFYKIINEGS